MLCCIIGHMLTVLSPFDGGRIWLEKVHQDYCGVQVKKIQCERSFKVTDSGSSVF